MGIAGQVLRLKRLLIWDRPVGDHICFFSRIRRMLHVKRKVFNLFIAALSDSIQQRFSPSLLAFHLGKHKYHSKLFWSKWKTSPASLETEKVRGHSILWHWHQRPSVQSLSEDLCTKWSYWVQAISELGRNSSLCWHMTPSLYWDAGSRPANGRLVWRAKVYGPLAIRSKYYVMQILFFIVK